MRHTLAQAGARKVDELAAAAASPRAVEHLRQLILEGTDLDCYKLNAFRMAEQAGVSRLDAIRALLVATRIGVVDLTWDVHCPSCRGVPEHHRRLSSLGRAAHCDLCDLRWDLDFEQHVEVTFTVNPDVRPIRYADWRDRDLAGQVRYLDDILPREGRDFVVGVAVAPDEPVSRAQRFAEGRFLCYAAGRLDGAATLVVEGAPTTSEQRLAVAIGADGALDRPALSARPGPLRFDVRSALPAVAGFVVRGVGTPPRWVSAAYVTALQDFRELFAGECLPPELSFELRSVTLLFADIDGSTRLYEELGDARAFELVRSYGGILAEVIRRHEGGIVKTLGDGVMAVFPENAQALRAAAAIQQAIGEAAALGTRIAVSLGLHRGPAIAVTTNRSLDYFGRTVNVARRVQAAAKGGEILASAEVLADPEAARAAADAGLSRTPREVRGLEVEALIARG